MEFGVAGDSARSSFGCKGTPGICGLLTFVADKAPALPGNGYSRQESGKAQTVTRGEVNAFKDVKQNNRLPERLKSCIDE